MTVLTSLPQPERTPTATELVLVWMNRAVSRFRRARQRRSQGRFGVRGGRLLLLGVRVSGQAGLALWEPIVERDDVEKFYAEPRADRL